MRLAIQRCAPDYVEQGSKMVGRFVGVTLMVDNIEEQYSRLVTKGVEFTGRPKKQSWGGTLAHLKDLDGNVLTLMQEASWPKSLPDIPLGQGLQLPQRKARPDP